MHQTVTTATSDVIAAARSYAQRKVDVWTRDRCRPEVMAVLRSLQIHADGPGRVTASVDRTRWGLIHAYVAADVLSLAALDLRISGRITQTGETSYTLTW
jgi:hypothetical protein